MRHVLRSALGLALGLLGLICGACGHGETPALPPVRAAAAPASAPNQSAAGGVAAAAGGAGSPSASSATAHEASLATPSSATGNCNYAFHIGSGPAALRE